MPRQPLARGFVLATAATTAAATAVATAVGVSALAAISTIALTATPVHAAGTPLPTAVFTKTSDWGTGFEAQYVLSNPMSVPLDHWTLKFTLPTSYHVTSMWGGTDAASNGVQTVSAQSYDTTIPAGGSVTIGFDASYSGSFVAPTACSLNSDPCDGSSDAVAPTTPSGLAVLSTTSSAVSLSWIGSTDNITVAGYHVYSGSNMVATSTGPAGTVTGLAPSTSYSFTVRAFDEAGNLSGTSAAVSATTQASTGGGHLPGVAAPFVDIGAWPTPNLTQIAQTTGLRQFSIGFIVNGTSTCSPSWFNAYTMTSGFEQSDIAGLRGMGGDVKPSFGGEAGTELAQSCTSVASLTAAYQSVVGNYHLTQIDFDIEGAAVADRASVDRRSQAMAALQRAATSAGSHVDITLTLPVLPSGLTADGLYVVRSAVNAGVKVTTVNVMAMDFGDVEAPNPAGQMGKYAIDSAKSLFGQLSPLYPGSSAAQVWNMVGVTPMIGQNDNASEVFTQTDMKQLLAFAQQQHLGELAFWDVTRDGNACTGSLSKCTNIPQSPYEFSKLIAPYQG
jgi:hypothetical protein